MIDFEKESRISKASQRKLFRWFARQNNEIWLEIFKEQKNYFYKFKNLKKYDLLDLTLLSFILAVSNIFNKINLKTTKRREYDLKNIKSYVLIRAKQIKKTRKREKYEKLLNLKSVIFHLKEKENMSFYQISNYLEKWHKLKVSHTYIRNFYIDLIKKEGEEYV